MKSAGNPEQTCKKVSIDFWTLFINAFDIYILRDLKRKLFHLFLSNTMGIASNIIENSKGTNKCIVPRNVMYRTLKLKI